MTNNKNKLDKKIFDFLAISIVGVIAGLLGALIFSSYFFTSSFTLPFFGQINFDSSNLGSNQLIIKQPQKVVIKQDLRAYEVINNIKEITLDIYPLVKTNQITNKFSLDNFYKQKDSLGKAIILSNNGWLLTNIHLDKNKKYIFVDKDKNKYKQEKIIYDKLTKYSFIKINNNNKALPVAQFTPLNEINPGQSVLIFDKFNNLYSSLIANLQSKNLIKSTEKFDCFVKINQNIKGAIVIDYKSRIIGFIGEQGVFPIINFNNALKYIFKQSKIKRPYLGISYYSLNSLVSKTDNFNNYGIIVYNIDTNSPSQKAGIKIGDNIVQINSTKLNEKNDFTKIIQSLNPGDEINLIIKKGNKEKMISVKLGEK